MRSPLTRDKFLTKPEQYQLRRSLGIDRDSILIRTALETGARASELLNISRKDIDAKEGLILIHGLKGSQDRDIGIPVELAEKILNVIPLGKDKPFPFSYRRLEQIWRLFRPTNKKFHSLRHSFAINLYEKKNNILLVQLALGHTHISNTMIYLDYFTSKDLAKETRDLATQNAVQTASGC